MFELVITALFLLPTAYYADKNPVRALVLVVLGLPTFLIRWSIGPIAFNTLDLLVSVSFVIFLISHTHELTVSIKNNKKLMYIAGIVLLTALIATLVSPNTVGALGILKSYFIIPILFFIISLTVIKQENDILRFIKAFSFLVLIIGSTTIFQKFFPEGMNGILAIPNDNWKGMGFRATSFLEYPNAIALFIAPLIPLLIALQKYLKNTYCKFINGISILVGLSGILLAKSKGALLALGVVLVLSILYTYRKNIAVIIASIALLLLLIAPNLDTLIRTAGPGSYSAQLRITQWKETKELLTDSPITGAGLAGFQSTIEPYHTTDFLEIFLYPHNIILNFWVELGLFGLIVFMVIITYSLTMSWRLRQNTLALGALAGMLIIIIHGLVDVPYFKNDLSVLFWFLWLVPFLIKNTGAAQK